MKLTSDELSDYLVEMQATILRLEEDIHRLRLPQNDSSEVRNIVENGSAFNASIGFVSTLEAAERLIYSLDWQLDAIADKHGVQLPIHQAVHDRIAYQDALCAATTD